MHSISEQAPFKPHSLRLRSWAQECQFASMTIDIDMARKRLAALRAELAGQSELSRNTRMPVELDQQAGGRLSRMDAIQHQKMAEAAERGRKRDLLRIEMAERRLAHGDHGYCTECGGEIPGGSLAIDPMAEKCVTCAGRRR